ncbi:hypothetical protein M9Y10_029968 [Tritrichomonas musculus]|uniref:Surface antigen BspA-like n=1 Tax=Tritrichomonas musculus TaxID=1915356 RepID=A0ABR2KQP3_9EUKA
MKLKVVAIPPNINSIGDSSFQWCSSLVQVSLPTSVTMICSCAFLGCSSLERIEIPRFVRLIGRDAFKGCSSQRRIEIPSSVESIGYNAFKDCTLLEHVTLLTKNIKCNRLSTFEKCASLKQITIPSSVTIIHDNAFKGCCTLRVVIPSSVEKFGRDIFNGVVSLEISGTIKEIPDSMFFNHLDLKEIFLSNSLCLRAIFSKAFYTCNNLTHITFPSSLKLIYGCAFM